MDARVVETDESTYELFMSANVPLATDVTPWLIATLPLAMQRGEALHLAGTADETTLRGSAAAQRLLAGWYRQLSIVPVTAQGTQSSGAGGSGVGCFFSGGVDSFFSLLKHADRITHLIFVLGFDIELEDDDLGAASLENARNVAQALGKPLIEVRTNMRVPSQGRLDWGAHYFGAALGAVGVAMAPTLREVIIPASFATADLRPWGSHPDLDPAWSSTGVRLTHDGVEATRWEKIAVIAGEQVALDHLRVCWENRAGAFNCGCCEKCLRTMVALHTVGALSKCRTMPSTFRRVEVARLPLTEAADAFAVENLSALRAMTPRDRRLEAALTGARLVGQVRRPMGRLKRRLANRCN